VDLFEPMFLWIALLLAAVAARVILSTTGYVPVGGQVYAIANSYPNFLLSFPGIIILPLIVGIMIGNEVGRRSTTLESALRSGLLNGMYASIMYVIAIVIIYIVLSYIVPQFTSQYLSVFNSVVFPILVFLLTLEIFSALSYSRRVDE
ncbi:MAG: hypothetical protein KGH62_05805, partial [Candidatus Micrarchaeota archaeon]|nr:hypothetical protein [Candidatus Micrarchaeota archaeon]